MDGSEERQGEPSPEDGTDVLSQPWTHTPPCAGCGSEHSSLKAVASQVFHFLKPKALLMDAEPYLGTNSPIKTPCLKLKPTEGHTGRGLRGLTKSTTKHADSDVNVC